MIEAGSSRVRPRLRGRPVASGAWASRGPSCGTPGHGVECAGNAGFEQRAAHVGNVDDSDQAGVAPTTGRCRKWPLVMILAASRTFVVVLMTVGRVVISS